MHAQNLSAHKQNKTLTRAGMKHLFGETLFNTVSPLSSAIASKGIFFFLERTRVLTMSKHANN